MSTLDKIIKILIFKSHMYVYYDSM